MLHPHEMVARLRANHLLALADEDAELLAARICGYRAGDIAAATFRSERTVRSHIERLLDLICIPAGLPRDAAVAAIWTFLHAECCAAAVFGHLGFLPAPIVLEDDTGEGTGP